MKILLQSYPQKSENVQPHSSQSSRENATPSSGTSPLAIHTYIRTCFLFEVLQCISTISQYLKLQTTKIPNHMWLIKLLIN